MDGIPLPLARLAECLSCGTDLHVCRLCKFFDTHVAKQCREPVAEDVTDKDRANFCGYFQACPGAHVAGGNREVQQAKEKLAVLFGNGGAEKGPSSNHKEEDNRQQLDDLFRKE